MGNRMSVYLKRVGNDEFPYIDAGSEAHGRTSFRLWVSHRLLKVDEKKAEEIKQLEQLLNDPKRAEKHESYRERICEIRERELYYIELPISGYIKKTEKGSLVLKPDPDHIVFDVYQQCGFRGSASLEILSPHVAAYRYAVYRSPLGNLGVDAGALVVVKRSDLPLKVRWSRTGRTYGAPKEGIRFYYEDGHIEDLDGLPDGLEAVEELKEEIY